MPTSRTWRCATNLVDAVDSIVSGPYLSDLSQYGTAARPISGTAVFDDSFTIVDPAPPAGNFTEGNAAAMLIQNMGNDTLPNPSTDPNLYYYVFTQPGSTLEGAFGAHGSAVFGGVRFPFGYGENDFAANIQLDRLTSTFSHELVEATSDPFVNIAGKNGIQVKTMPGQGNIELSDNFANGAGPQNFDYRLNGVLVQSYWSANTFDATAAAGAPLGAAVVPTGQLQDFYVNRAGVLTIVGDQIGVNDAIAISLAANNGVLVTENGETAQFEPSPSPLGRVTVSAGITVKNGAGDRHDRRHEDPGHCARVDR